jgi:AcrR family transcriptional regulator
MEAALDIIAEQGIEALTIKNIAGRVGFRDAAIYRHFRSKSAILAAMADRFAENSQTILQQIAASDQPALKKVEAFFMDRCQLFARDKVVVTVMFAEELFKSDRALQERVDDIIAAHQRLLSTILSAGQQSGEIRPLPIDHLFLIIMGGLRLMVTRWLASQRGFDLVAAGQRLWSSLAQLIALPV